MTRHPHVWLLVSAAIVAASLSAFGYILKTQMQALTASRTDLCTASQETRTVIRQILLASRAQSREAGTITPAREAYYNVALKLAHPLDCAEIVNP